MSSYPCLIPRNVLAHKTSCNRAIPAIGKGNAAVSIALADAAHASPDTEPFAFDIAQRIAPYPGEDKVRDWR